MRRSPRRSSRSRAARSGRGGRREAPTRSSSSDVEPEAEPRRPRRRAREADCRAARLRVARVTCRPLAVAITGGIGAGKSTALECIRRHGAATVSSDEIVHQLLRERPRGRRRARRALRRGDPRRDGKIDRDRIARRVFDSPTALDCLEELLHPLVSPSTWPGASTRDAAQSAAVCVTEVPLLYEVGGETRFDKVVVTAPEKLREARGEGRSTSAARLVPDHEKVARADFSYVNDGSLAELDAWVAGVMATLTTPS